MNRMRLAGRGGFAALALATIIIFTTQSAVQAGEPSVEKPVDPACALVLDNVMDPGTRVDVSKYKGRPVLIRGMCPE